MADGSMPLAANDTQRNPVSRQSPMKLPIFIIYDNVLYRIYIIVCSFPVAYRASIMLR